jgi:hypothetical protein
MTTLLMMQLLARMQKDSNGISGDAPTGAGKAAHRLLVAKNRVFSEPHRVIGEYVEDSRKRVNAEVGDPWQLWGVSANIRWGRHVGLHRIHHHLSHVVALGLKGQVAESMAYGCVLLRAVHQCSLDNGQWDVANLMVPGEDPCTRSQFATGERDLETILAYQEAMKKLKKKSSKEDGDEDEAAPKQPPHGGPKKK